MDVVDDLRVAAWWLGYELVGVLLNRLILIINSGHMEDGYKDLCQLIHQENGCFINETNPPKVNTSVI